MQTYKITTDHPASSYGEPVLLNSQGTPCKAGDLGMFGLSANACGRVDAIQADGTSTVFWSGYGDNPDKMWRALRVAHEAHPDLSEVRIFDAGKIELSHA